MFVALDDGPGHPVFPGVGFISIPHLPWQRFDSAEDVVQVGQRVACEARLSLRALQPDPVRAFLAAAKVGQVLRGTVTKLVPFGAFVQVADGVEGLVHLQEMEAPLDALQVGDQILVAVAGIDRDRRRLALSQRAVSAG